MSNNGHAAPEPTNKEQYRAIREQLRLSQAKLELLDTQAKVGLLESVTLGGGGAGSWGSFVDPFDAYRDADGRQWFTLNNRHDRKDGANRPFVWTDFDLDVIRAQARWVVTKNPLATGALATFRNFTIRTGYKYEAQPDKRFATNPVALELAYQVQDLVDDFIDLNQWSVRERSAFYRSRRDGEVFIRCFPQDDGSTIVRFVEPEQVRMPTGAPRQYLYGILTDSKDIELPLKYSIQYDVDNPADMEEIDADEIAHLKLNVDECVKRGLSDLYSTGEAFDGVHKLLRNMREAGAIQAAIAWIEQYDNATASQIAGMATTQRDANRAYPDNPITGRPVNLQKMEPGTIVKTQKNKTYVPAPLAGNTTNHAAIVQACLRAIATRWSMPEYMISGDSSNSNFASTLVSGGPFVIAVEAEQDVYRRYFLRIIWTAIRNACERGKFVLGDRIFDDFEELQRLIDVNVTPPQVAIANKKEEADIDAIDMQNGVMSLQTRRARRGLDNDQEVQNLKKEPPTRVSGKVTDLDPEGDPTKPGAEQEDASAEDEKTPAFFPRISAG